MSDFYEDDHEWDPAPRPTHAALVARGVEVPRGNWPFLGYEGRTASAQVLLTPTFIAWVVARSGLSLPPKAIPRSSGMVYRFCGSQLGSVWTPTSCVVCRRPIGAGAGCVVGCGDDAHAAHLECAACVAVAGPAVRCLGELRREGPLCRGVVECELTAELKEALDAKVLPTLAPALAASMTGPCWAGFRRSVWFTPPLSDAYPSSSDNPPCRVCGLPGLDSEAPECRTCPEHRAHWAHRACYAYFCEVRARLYAEVACPCALFPEPGS